MYLHTLRICLHLFQHLRFVSVHLQTYMQSKPKQMPQQMQQQMQTNATINANKCHNRCKHIPQEMQTHATTNATTNATKKCKQMPQHMQKHATTNASTCRALRQKMDQTYVKINAVTCVYLIFEGPGPSGAALLDKAIQSEIKSPTPVTLLHWLKILKRAKEGFWKTSLQRPLHHFQIAKPFSITPNTMSRHVETAILCGKYHGFDPSSRRHTLHSGQTETPDQILTTFWIFLNYQQKEDIHL